jgi:3-dehydroquinate synthase
METQTFCLQQAFSYDVLLGDGIIPQVVARLNRMGFSRKCLIVTNQIVEKWYLEPLTQELSKRGFTCRSVVLPDGEDQKTLESAGKLYTEMLAADLDRKSPVIALGGGVIGDLTGFAAATFHRGLPFVQLPTTLLAMVDASIGGKTAVNLPEGKNLVGAFYQPCLVGMDLNTLQTLPLTQLNYGLSECVKHSLIADRAYFRFLLKHRHEIKEKSPAVLRRTVRRSLNIKRQIVETDQFDRGQRKQLNLGHTFGHALEILGEFRRFHHGEAVALGMLMSVEASRELGLLKEDFREALEGLLADFGLPLRLSKEYPPEAIFTAMTRDKKREKKDIHLILPDTLGSVQVVPVPVQDLQKLLLACLSSLYQ